MVWVGNSTRNQHLAFGRFEVCKMFQLWYRVTNTLTAPERINSVIGRNINLSGRPSLQLAQEYVTISHRDAFARKAERVAYPA